MKTPNPWNWMTKSRHHDEAVNNLAEDNCLFIIGICIFLDRVRRIYNLGLFDK
jgi:hypothetical protein